MKIGVITHWGTKDNYGQILQAFALQKKLRSYGHDVFLINYKTQLNSLGIRTIVRISDLPFKAFRFLKRSLFSFIKRIQEKNHSRHFDSFINEHIVLSKRQYKDINDLQNDPPDADAYIVGSDQVWNSSEYSPIYFLDFGPQNIIRCSYAASFGSREIVRPEVRKQISNALLRFSYVSLREEYGVKLCRDFQVKSPELVPDPTLLLSTEDYIEELRLNPEDDRSCFIYLLSNSTAIPHREIKRFCHQKKVKPYVVTNYPTLRYHAFYPGIKEWLLHLASAEYVITNSFHGVVFSIIFNRQFISLPLKHQDPRLDTLLGKYNLLSRRYSSGSIEQYFQNRINYDEINKKLPQERNMIYHLLEHLKK